MGLVRCFKYPRLYFRLYNAENSKKTRDFLENILLKNNFLLMLYQKNFKFNNCIGHHSLLYGETDTRKSDGLVS